MQDRKYNENAAAFTWEIINDSEDIGSWELLYEDQLIKGTGFIEFLSAAQQLSPDIDNVELRNWDSFWKKIEDKEEFIKRLEICRTYFNHGEGGNRNKNKLSLKNHYKSTLTKEMWKDMYNAHFLYQPWAKNFCEKLLPQTPEELFFMNKLDKAGFYYRKNNYKYTDVHCYDISSAFLSFMMRKKYPYTAFVEADTIEQIQEIISGKFYCYYGVFEFHKLEYRIDFPVDLGRFGEVIENEICGWRLLLTNVDMDWFKKVFKWESCEPVCFFYAQQKELDVRYADMFNQLYEYKSVQKKGTFAKEIYKTRAELVYGYSIKAPDYCAKTVYNEKLNIFEVVENEEKSFKQIQFDLAKRGIPMYIGLWTSAYARAEFVKVLSLVGIDNVVYGDTDSIKFVGDEGVNKIEEYNKEIEKEFQTINKKRHLIWNKNIGKWMDEGTVNYFKSIANKWYLTVKDGEIDVKAAGVDAERIKEFLKGKKNPYNYFFINISVPNLRYTIGYSRNNPKAIELVYDTKIDSDMKKELFTRGTTLHYFNPYEEV